MSNDLDFAALMESSSPGEQQRVKRRLRAGEVVEGTVVQIGQDSIFVDVGATVEARLDRSELEDKSGALPVKVGDLLRASVVRSDDVMGPVLTLALGKSSSTKGGIDLQALESAKQSGLPVMGSVQRAVKGGLEVSIAGVRAFCPASQVDTTYQADLSLFEGQTLSFRVTEIKDGGKSVVVSRKALLEEERKQQGQRVLEQLRVGGDFEGTVSSVQKYGAFVDLGGGVEGLVHVSELAHARIERVEDVLSVGEKVLVRLLAIEPPEKGTLPKLRLSLKARQEAPEVIVPGVGEVLTGKVSKLATFGIFVDTPKGTGLVPVRELGIPKGADFRKQFPLEKEVQVVLVSREDSGRLTFSIERVAGVEERENYRVFHARTEPNAPASSSVGSLGLLLQQKLGIQAAPEPKPEPTPRANPAPEQQTRAATPVVAPTPTTTESAASAPATPAPPVAAPLPASKPFGGSAPAGATPPPGVFRRRG